VLKINSNHDSFVEWKVRSMAFGPVICWVEPAGRGHEFSSQNGLKGLKALALLRI